MISLFSFGFLWGSSRYLSRHPDNRKTWCSNVLSTGTSNPSWWGKGFKLLKGIPQNLLLNQGDEDEDDVDDETEEVENDEDDNNEVQGDEDEVEDNEDDNYEAEEDEDSGNSRGELW